MQINQQGQRLSFFFSNGKKKKVRIKVRGALLEPGIHGADGKTLRLRCKRNELHQNAENATG